MKKSRFAAQQIAFILKQAEDSVPVEEICRKAGMPALRRKSRSFS